MAQSPHVYVHRGGVGSRRTLRDREGRESHEPRSQHNKDTGPSDWLKDPHDHTEDGLTGRREIISRGRTPSPEGALGLDPHPAV